MITIVENLPMPKRSKQLIENLGQHVLVLDGGLGTMIQRLNLEESDFSSGCGCHHCQQGNHRLKGCNDILTVSKPEVIAGIHRAYLEAGADIIETDTFNANALSLADYRLSDRVTEINLAGARIAKEVSEKYSAETGRPTWVAGSIGPTSKSLTMAANLNDPITWNEMTEAYMTQATALIDGGVDLLLIETVFDVLNAKAAVYACREAMRRRGISLPVIISITLTESGRTLSGMTPLASFIATSHANPLAVGYNCGFGAEAISKYIDEIQDIPAAIIMYPNAGLPNELGEYDESPDMMAEAIKPLLDKRKLNIVGGCCGTTPEHIAAIARIAHKAHPRPIPERDTTRTLFSGLEPLDADRCEFINVGERCNVAGSRKFLRLIKEDNIDEAVDIARGQVAKGAAVIDINMDDGMLDTVACMNRFLVRIATEPSVARVPLMIDSSDFNVVKSALTLIQGRPIVNSISLKEGEEKFIEHAREIHELGGAMVVMAFDEQGQATTVERRIEVCRRAYTLLTEQAMIPAGDIIFDPNILAVATGLPEHNSYGKDFIDAAGWIMENLPGVNVSGGLSNLSFSFRGNDFVRNAIHSIFIAKARERGMKMAIVNPSGILDIATLPADLVKAIDDVLLNTDSGATDRLIETAGRYQPEKKTPKTATTETNGDTKPVEQRLADAIINGTTENLDNMLSEALAKTGSAVNVIDRVLMKGMDVVGERFGAGEMFLPQVVKSATVMQRAVEILTPEIEKERAADNSSGDSTGFKMVLATVKGDVHDIGKNIVDVVMRCNGFDIIDLGVMTPAEKIIDTAIETGADCIGLSGLITPSLAEMSEVARQMQARGLSIPLFIGGATTSELHTALKIAPLYDGAVIHTRDAAALAAEAKKYLDKSTSAKAVEELRNRQQKLRDNHSAAAKTVSVAEARKRKPQFSFDFEPVAKRVARKVIDIQVADVADLINFRQFLSAWKLDPNDMEAPEAKKVIGDAHALLDRLIAEGTTLKGCVKFMDAAATDDDILLLHDTETNDIAARIPMLRQSVPSPVDGTTLALTDFFPNEHSGKTLPAGLFAVTVTGSLHDRIVTDPKSYDGILADLLFNRLAEAATQWLHDSLTAGSQIKGIRPAIGYSSAPDQSLLFLLDKQLDYASLDITVTDAGALFPSSTTTGLFIFHPDARYFSVLPVGNEQRADYASRRGMTDDEINRFVP